MTTKFPKTLGSCIDRAYTLKLQIAEQNKVVKQLEEQLSELNTHIKEQLALQKAKGASGKLGKFNLLPVTKPQVEDWDEFYRYINRNKAYDMLQRRLNEAAIKDRWEAGKAVSGVTKFEGVKVSITKA